MRSIADMFDTAIKRYGAETSCLRFLPENRYNRSIFPTTGQYDWFSGQALYCLVRYVRPKRIVEISTSSGYSTLFMAMAIKENGFGSIDTFELDRRAAMAAEENFKRYDVSEYIDLHIGDARKTSKCLSVEDKKEVDIMFLDSLHTESFARWFIENFVLLAKRNALFHMHDILPLHATVRCWDGPPWEDAPPYLHNRRGIIWKIMRMIRSRPDDQYVVPKVRNPSVPGELPTYDGNRTTEAIFGNKLADLMSRDHYVFCYDIADKYPTLNPREYDDQTIARQDAKGHPFEWNESFWAFAGPLADAYAKLCDTIAY